MERKTPNKQQTKKIDDQQQVIRKLFHIPTVDEFLHELNQHKIFSTSSGLTIKWNCLQLQEVLQHHGIYRYKRLLFGMSLAPEMNRLGSIRVGVAR